MPKPKRGRNIKTPGWRGTCPSCEKTGMKLLWTKTSEDGGAPQKVCKNCGK